MRKLNCEINFNNEELEIEKRGNDIQIDKTGIRELVELCNFHHQNVVYNLTT